MYKVSRAPSRQLVAKRYMYLKIYS